MRPASLAWLRDDVFIPTVRRAPELCIRDSIPGKIIDYGFELAFYVSIRTECRRNEEQYRRISY